MVTRARALFAIRLVGLLSFLVLFEQGYDSINRFRWALGRYYHFNSPSFLSPLFHDFHDELFASLAFLFCAYLMLDGRLLLPLLMRGLTPEHEHRCPSCGFDLSETTSPGCPECGWGRRARPTNDRDA